MSERRIIFAGPPPAPRFSWARAGLALVVAAALVAAAALLVVLPELDREAERRRAAAQAALVQALHAEYLSSAGTRAAIADLRRPRPERPMTPSETAGLLLSGAPRNETLQAYRASLPYEGPPESELRAREAGHIRSLARLYAEAARAGLSRDGADARVAALARAVATAGTTTAAPAEAALTDVIGAIEAERARAGLPPLAERDSAPPR
jgi:hypothetical protein